MADQRDVPRRRKIDWFLEAQPGYLTGLELAPPDVQDVIRHKARWKKQWVPSPTVVRPEEFVPYDEAKRLLQRRGAPWPSYKHAQADGLVHLVYRCSDGEEGLSRASVDRELQWRHTATRGGRFRRRVRLLTAPLLGPWRYPTET